MITVLTSGVALGVHVPGVLLARRLQAAGVESRVVVLETLLADTVLARAEAHRAVLHGDFRLARAAHRLARPPAAEADLAKLDALFERWHAENARRFVVVSGFWLPLLHRYADVAAAPITVDLCHVDAVDSPSFHAGTDASPRRQHSPGERWRSVRLADAASGTLPCTIPVTDQPPIAWPDRLGRPRVLAHGGGWGMGTYREAAARMADHGIAVDLVLHNRNHPPGPPGSRCFAIDEAWHPWRDAGFPPFAELPPTGDGVYRRGSRQHSSFALVRGAVAVASKPGGGTLLDSLHAATPLLLLAALAPHEERNAALWRERGFGLDFEPWLAAGCPTEPLEACHRRLCAARTTIPDYSRHLTEEIVASC